MASHYAALDRAAFDWNISRSAVLLSRPEGLTATLERVLSVVTGLWLALGDDTCTPETGDHAPDCAHAANLIPATASDLARLTFGTSRGRGGYLKRSKRAMDDLALWRGRTRWPEDGGYVTRTGGILSTLSRDGDSIVVDDLRGNREFIIAFDPFLHRDMMAGHFTYVPVDVVQALTGLDFKVYSAVVCAAGTRRIVGKKQPSIEYAITGPDAAFPPVRLGFGAFAREDEMEDRLLASIDRINAAQRDYQFRLRPRSNDGGLKIVVRYAKVQKEIGDSVVGIGDSVVGIGDSVVHESRSDWDVKAYLRLSQDKMYTTPSGGLSERDTIERVMLSLAARYPKGPTKRQFNLLDGIAARHGGWQWVENTMAARPHGTDPILFVRTEYWRSTSASLLE